MLSLFCGSAGLLRVSADRHLCIGMRHIDGCVSEFLPAPRWICESQMSMNSSSEILDLIRGGRVNGGGKGVAPCLSYCPRAASSSTASRPLLYCTKRWVIKSYFSRVALFYAAYIFKILLHCCSTHDQMLLFGYISHTAHPCESVGLSAEIQLLFLASKQFLQPTSPSFKFLLRCCEKEKKIFKRLQQSMMLLLLVSSQFLIIFSQYNDKKYDTI